MKRHFLIPFLFALALLVSQNSASAKELKLGYVDSDRILDASEDYKEAREQLQKEEREFMTQAQTLEKVVEDMYNELKNQSLMLSDEARAEREQRVRDKQQELDSFRRDVWGEQGRLFTRNLELSKPILEKINGAIEKVSQEDSYDFVFDAASANIVYALPEHDLTDRVLDLLKKE